jgi:hypothetical protein
MPIAIDSTRDWTDLFSPIMSFQPSDQLFKGIFYEAEKDVTLGHTDESLTFCNANQALFCSLRNGIVVSRRN